MKNIIFDLGGVVIDLGFEDMLVDFERLGIADFGQYFNPLKQQDLFLSLELGLISELDFYEGFRNLTQSSLSDEQIKKAWNLIIRPFQAERMAFLEALRKNYKLYLFSNTNAIHAEYFEKNCLEQMNKPLDSYFEKLYYSHELHERKPEVSAFERVIADAGLVASETLFVDDNAENIAGAQLAGLRVHHLLKAETILNIGDVLAI